MKPENSFNILKLFAKILLIICIGILTGCILTAGALAVKHRNILCGLIIGLSAFAVSWIIYRKLSGKVHFHIEIKKTLIILTVLSAAVNYFTAWSIPVYPHTDYLVFWNCANDLCFGGELSAARYVALFPHILGYSTLISKFIEIFGPSLTMVKILNTALSTVSGLLIFAFIYNYRRDESGLKAAALGYLLWIFFPSKNMFNAFVLSEPVYTMLILAFLVIILMLEKKEKKISAAIAAGVLLGIVLRAVNCLRPLAAILIIAFFIWIFMLQGSKKKKHFKFWVPLLAVMLLVYIAGGMLWNSYFEKRVGEPPASTPLYNIYVGFNPETSGAYNDEDMATLMEYSDIPGAGADWAQHQMKDNVIERLTSGEINYPVHFIKKLAVLAGKDNAPPYYLNGILPDKTLLFSDIVCNSFYYCIILWAVYGCIRMYKERERGPVLLAVLYTVGLILAHMLTEVAPRYHYSILPMLVIMLAYTGKRKITE